MIILLLLPPFFVGMATTLLLSLDLIVVAKFREMLSKKP